MHSATDGSAQHAVIRAADGNYYGTVRRRVVVGGLHLSEMTYDDGTRIPSHQHECPSLFMPLRGAFVEGCTGTVRSYAPGDVSYHPPYEPHWLDTRGAVPGTTRDTSARGFAIEIDAGWYASLGVETRWDGVPRNLSLASASWVMGRLYQELSIHDTARPLVIEAIGVELGTRLMDVTYPAPARTPRWLGRVRDALHDSMRGVGKSTPSLTILASLANVTPVAVIKGFRRHLGCTPGTYLRTLRLAAARRALIETDARLSDIAVEAGFYDQSHFSRAFRASAGVTPGRYRWLFLTI